MKYTIMLGLVGLATSVLWTYSVGWSIQQFNPVFLTAVGLPMFLMCVGGGVLLGMRFDERVNP